MQWEHYGVLRNKPKSGRALGSRAGAYRALARHRGSSGWSVHGRGRRRGQRSSSARGSGAEARQRGKTGLWVAVGARGRVDWRMAHCRERISRRGARRQQWRQRLALAYLLLEWNGKGLARLKEQRGRLARVSELLRGAVSPVGVKRRWLRRWRRGVQ